MDNKSESFIIGFKNGQLDSRLRAFEARKRNLKLELVLSSDFVSLCANNYSMPVPKDLNN